MSESVDSVSNTTDINNTSNSTTTNNNSNSSKNSSKILHLTSTINNHITPTGISRERSFIRPTNQQNLQVSECI